MHFSEYPSFGFATLDSVRLGFFVNAVKTPEHTTVFYRGYPIIKLYPSGVTIDTGGMNHWHIASLINKALIDNHCSERCFMNRGLICLDGLPLTDWKTVRTRELIPA